MGVIEALSICIRTKILHFYIEESTWCNTEGDPGVCIYLFTNKQQINIKYDSFQVVSRHRVVKN